MGVLRRIHDRVFRDRVYRVRDGFFRGYLRTGRMPWFQRRLRDPDRLRELRFFEALDLRGKVAFDVGASIGPHTGLLCRLAGAEGAVYSFEPEPESFRALTEFLALNRLRNVVALPLGLGSTPGRFTMVVPDSARVALAGTLRAEYRRTLRADQVLREVTVEVVRLDDLRAAGKVPLPDLIKIDVEGFEFEVVQGAREVIAAARPLLFIEIHGLDGAAKQAMTASITEFLAPFGYRFSHLESGAEWAPGQPVALTAGHLICRPDPAPRTS